MPIPILAAQAVGSFLGKHWKWVVMLGLLSAVLIQNKCADYKISKLEDKYQKQLTEQTQTITSPTRRDCCVNTAHVNMVTSVTNIAAALKEAALQGQRLREEADRIRAQTQQDRVAMTATLNELRGYISVNVPAEDQCEAYTPAAAKVLRDKLNEKTGAQQ